MISFATNADLKNYLMKVNSEKIYITESTQWEIEIPPLREEKGRFGRIHRIFIQKISENTERKFGI